MPKNLGLLQAGAAERQFHELWKVTLTDGTVLRFADTNADIQHDVGDGAGPQTWRGGFGVERTEMRAGMDLQIDTLSVTVRNTDLELNGVTRPMGHWVKVRKFHGAEVRVYVYDYRAAASVLDTIWYIQGARDDDDRGVPAGEPAIQARRGGPALRLSARVQQRHLRQHLRSGQGLL